MRVARGTARSRVRRHDGPGDADLDVIDPGWQNDVSLRGNTMVAAFDPVVVGPHVSLCLRQKSDPNNSTASVTRGGVQSSGSITTRF